MEESKYLRNVTYPNAASIYLCLKFIFCTLKCMICINKHNKLLKMTIGNYFRLKVGEFFVKQYLKFEKEWFGRFILDGVFCTRRILPIT